MEQELTTTPTRDEWFTFNRAAAVVMVLLAGAAVLGFVERRTRPADDIPLDALPGQIGAWTAVDQEIETQPDGSYLLLKRTYEDGEGRRAFVTVQATYTRLGSLRDWSLAATAAGWTTGEETIWHSDDGQMSARVQQMVHKTDTQVALTWYTSAHSQAPSLKNAEILGARDRLAGEKKPWASLYVVANTGASDVDRKIVEEIGSGLAPCLRQIMSQAGIVG